METEAPAEIGRVGRKLNCCSIWSVLTKLMAIAQIVIILLIEILSVIAMVKPTPHLVDVMVMKDVNWLPAVSVLKTNQQLSDQQIADRDMQLVFLTGVLIILLTVVLLPGIVMGVVLFLGSLLRKPYYLKAWLVYALFLLLLFIGLAIFLPTPNGFIRVGVIFAAMILVKIHLRELQGGICRCSNQSTKSHDLPMSDISHSRGDDNVFDSP